MPLQNFALPKKRLFKCSVTEKNEMPTVALHWEHYFKHILNKYNSIYKVQLPNITPHVCRHTFCSNMAKSGMKPRTLPMHLCSRLPMRPAASPALY
ncbi:MAG: hypothetical protein E7463_05225 [Ruminococcaceae bacterium]|nr:hypothetical protein [Oscillospiraceae bacterium]